MIWRCQTCNHSISRHDEPLVGVRNFWCLVCRATTSFMSTGSAGIPKQRPALRRGQGPLRPLPPPPPPTMGGTSER